MTDMKVEELQELINDNEDLWYEFCGDFPKGTINQYISFKKIYEEVDYIDIKPYSHNLISINLEIISKDKTESYNYAYKFGKTRNEIVDYIILKWGLDEKGWGHLVKTDEKD